MINFGAKHEPLVNKEMHEFFENTHFWDSPFCLSVLFDAHTSFSLHSVYNFQRTSIIFLSPSTHYIRCSLFTYLVLVYLHPLIISLFCIDFVFSSIFLASYSPVDRIRNRIVISVAREFYQSRLISSQLSLSHIPL